jgi:hypothetical protein
MSGETKKWRKRICREDLGWIHRASCSQILICEQLEKLILKIQMMPKKETQWNLKYPYATIKNYNR